MAEGDPYLPPLSVAELREWLKIPHRDDDPAIAAAIRSAVQHWQASTGRTAEAMTEMEWMAVRMEAAGIVKFRGDDVVAPDRRFVDNIRRAYNGNAVG